MQRVLENDTVTIIYDGFLSTGEQFDSSQEAGPMQFQMGTGSVLPAFEQAVLGMTQGETKRVTIAAKDAYGLKNEDLIITVSRQGLPDQPIAPGMVLGMNMDRDGEAHKIPATVLAVAMDSVTVDFNHPLAGQDITYEITLLSIDTQTAAGKGCGCAQTRGGGCS